MGVKLLHNGYEEVVKALKKASDLLEEDVSFGHGYKQEYNVSEHITGPLIWAMPFNPIFNLNNGIAASFETSLLFLVPERMQVHQDKSLDNYEYTWSLAIQFFANLVIIANDPPPNKTPVRVLSVSKGTPVQGATDKHMTGHLYTVTLSSILKCCE